MKNKIALLPIIVLLICCVGCDLPFLKKYESIDPAEITNADSVSRLDIYPENEKFELVGKLDRQGYGQLNSTQKGIYILLDNALYNMQTGYISLGKAAAADIDKAYCALRNDRPEYFWLPMSYSLRTNGSVGEICFAKTESDWLYTAAERKTLEAKIKNRLTEAMSGFDGAESEYSRELAAHDSLLATVEYDYENVDSYENNPGAWNIVGAFCDGKAVCEGYAKAMQVLSFSLGLNSATVVGVTEEPHMWNVISIEGSWYHLDPTANDTKEEIYHFFFNVTTESLLADRTIDPLYTSVENSEELSGNIFLPNCTATEYNYHVLNSLYIAQKSQVESTVVSIICDARRSGKRMVEFAVSPEMGFVFGSTDAAEFFKLEKCISVANSELGSKRIKKFSYGGVAGALGFMVSW